MTKKLKVARIFGAKLAILVAKLAPNKRNIYAPLYTAYILCVSLCSRPMRVRPMLVV